MGQGLKAGIDKSLDNVRKIESRKRIFCQSRKIYIFISLSTLDFREWEDEFLFLFSKFKIRISKFSFYSRFYFLGSRKSLILGGIFVFFSFFVSVFFFSRVALFSGQRILGVWLRGILAVGGITRPEVVNRPVNYSQPPHLRVCFCTLAFSFVYLHLFKTTRWLFHICVSATTFGFPVKEKVKNGSGGIFRRHGGARATNGVMAGLKMHSWGEMFFNVSDPKSNMYVPVPVPFMYLYHD